MTPRRALVGLVGVALALAACGGPPPPPPPAPPKPAAAPAPPAPAAAVPAAKPGAPAARPGALLPQTPDLKDAAGAKYEPRGRRDPFASLETTGGPGGLTVASTRLTGIVRGQRATLALLETADGIGYILKPGDTLGDGRLIEIGQDTVVFAVTPKPGTPGSGRVVLRLPAN